MLTPSREDYIRAIYILNNPSSKEIADYLCTTKAATSIMLKKLKEQGLVDIKPYSKPRLTKRGLKKAKELTFKHRVIESFLAKIGVKGKKIHEEAHKIEHSISLSTIKKIYKFLGEPKQDPHGEEIIW